MTGCGRGQVSLIGRAICGGLGACALLWGGIATAQSCTSYPYTFSTGTTAYAAQVNANFACAALLGGANFTGPITLSASNGRAGISFVNGPTGAVFNDGNMHVEGGGNLWLNGNGNGDVFLAWGGGDVGIRTYAPTDALDVAAPVVFGATSSERLSLNAGSIGFNRQVATGLIYNTTISAYQWQRVESTTASSDWLELQVYNPSGGMVTGAAIAINGTGGVTVGGGEIDGWLFTVDGFAGGTQAWATTSDARLKTSVTPITGALAAVMQLQGVRYSFIPAQDRTLGQDLKLPHTPQVGFLAQDVAKVAPEAVVTPADPTKGVYGLMESKLIPYLVEAIKAQQAEIATLQTQVAALQGTH
jgi:hypothetical protein